jgi:hypothetical protein
MKELFIYAVIAGIFTICPAIAIYNLRHTQGYIASLHRRRRGITK